MVKLGILDVQEMKKSNEQNLAFMTNVPIIQNGIAGHYAQKAVVAVCIKDTEYASMARLVILVAQPVKMKRVKNVKKIHVHTGVHGQNGVNAIKNVVEVIK